MAMTFSEIFKKIAEYLDMADFAGAANALERELVRPSLSQETRSSCLRWLGVCHTTMAAEAQYRDMDASRAQVLLESAETAYRDALALTPGSVSVRLGLARLILDRGKDPAEALSCLAAIDRAEASPANSSGVDEVHSAFMLLAATYCLASRFTEGMDHYRFALSGRFRDELKEPDLSCFARLRAYGVPVPRELKKEVLRLVGEFRVVNGAGLSYVQQLPVVDDGGG